MIGAIITWSNERLSDVYNMPIMEFLAYTVYIRQRNKERASDIERNRQQRQLNRMYR